VTAAPPVDRFPLAAVQAVLFLLGVALGVWGAFLVPLRLPGGLEGLADVIALGGNLVVGLAAARGTGSLLAAAMPGIGWLVTVLVLGSVARPSDEVVLPGALPTDPGIGTVSALFLAAGALGTILAVVISNRRMRAPRRGYTPGPARPTSEG
jgi:hypothetical protein